MKDQKGSKYEFLPMDRCISGVVFVGVHYH